MTSIHDVAKAAGVSISTVSYALSGNRPVSDKTRRRIEDAVQELGYQPNAGARMLAGRRTHIFALTEPLRADTHAPTHMAFVLATAVAARKRGYDILLLTDEQASAGMSRVAATDLVDAILVLDVAPDDERVKIARSVQTPTIFVGIPDDHEDLHCVDLDFEGVGSLAVDRLADIGHRKIALIGQSDLAYRRSNFPRRLLQGFRERAAQRGIAQDFAASGSTITDPAVVRTATETAIDSGATALVLHAADDVHTLVLTVLAERGLQVGEDISVLSAGTSFDSAVLPVAVDTIPLIPQISCDLAVDLAVRSLDEPLTPSIHLIPPEYHEVGSVAPPRG
ncbi:LacI family DNA-binding transcriptional regulator [Microbacterium sp. A588]